MRTPEKDPTIRDLLRIFSRRRRIIELTIGASMAIAILLCIFVTRRYQAAGTIELQKSSSDGMGLDSMISGASGGASDALSLNIDIQTQSAILRSTPLALSVIRKLNLESTRDFEVRPGLLSWLWALVTPSGAADPPGASLDGSPHRSQRLLKVFDKNLAVKSIAGTRLIEVDFNNSDPKVAAAAVNAIIAELIDFNFQVRFTATNQASKWLEGQLNDLRDQSEALQARVVAMQKSTGLFGVGGVDPQGKPVIYSPALDRLQQSTAALAQAEGNLILKGAVSNIANSGDAEMISQLSGPMTAASPGVVNSLSLIQSMRAQEATATAQEQEDAGKYGENNPRLIDERAAIARIQRSIKDETARIAGRAGNDFQVSKKLESGQRLIYERDRQAAERLNDKTIEYTILQREADQSQQLYQSLLSRLKEAGVLEGLHTSNLTVVSRARQPAIPSRPNVPLYLVSGFGLGALLGLGLALARDGFDNRIQTTEEIEQMGLPIWGLFPTLEADRPRYSLPMLAAPRSPYAEAVRTLRTTLQLSRAGSRPKVILVTSAAPNEGKSTLAVNLSVAYAQGGSRVLLVETDMRRPVLKNRFGLGDAPGLSELLSDSGLPPKQLAMPGVRNLLLVAGGPPPPSSADLLGSAQFRKLMEEWRSQFDVVVLDAPPVLPITDAHLIAHLADATLLVARSGVTTRGSLDRARRVLEPHLVTPTIGIAFNAILEGSQVYTDYYGYPQSTRHGPDSDHATNGHRRLSN